ncbi:MAG: hypothetical protein MUD06_00500 [Rhodospirillales bacterium]|jgi:hypothetical protein|nr:hypothetical protein [Rhodospirillales bacterium]
MTETKPWYLSKGFVGPLVTVIALILENLGIMKIDPSGMSDIILQTIALLGAAVGMVGRAVASAQLTKA